MIALALLLLQPAADGVRLLESGFAHYSEGRFEQARDVLQKAAKLRPGSFETQFLLGATLVQLNDSAAAIPHLQRACTLNPAHADARKLLASQYLQVRRPKEAALLLRAPADEEESLLAIEARQSAGDSPGALALAQQAAKRFPESSQIAAWLGFQMQFAGRYEEARTLLERALKLDPSFAVATQLMGETYLKEERYKEALPWLEKAAQQMPGDTETLLSLARAVAETGDTARAIELLNQGSQEDARVHLQLSKLYFKSGDEAKARAASERSIKLRETNPVKDGAPILPRR